LISKALISQIRLLHHKKYRDEQGVFMVEGVKSCMEVLQSDFEVQQCFVTNRYSERCEESQINRIIISEKEMERISTLTTASEILCIVKKTQYNLNDLDDASPLLVLDALRDPGNLGAIIRTADWFGFTQILCSEDCVEFTNPKVIQATMGSFTRVKIVYANLADYLRTQNTRNIFGLYMNGEPIHKQSFNNNDMVIIGSESHGISESLTSFIHTKIKIPIFPHENAAPESLNASIAAAIFMYSFQNNKF